MAKQKTRTCEAEYTRIAEAWRAILGLPGAFPINTDLVAACMHAAQAIISGTDQKELFEEEKKEA
jgi:hypothetical protein